MRNLLLAVSRNTALRDLAVRLGPVRRTVDRFVAGETVDDALRVVRALAASGLRATIDHLGEDTTSQDAALAATQANLELLRRLGDEGLAAVTEVSVKASAIGQALPGGADLALENAGRICAAAAEVGTTITLDAEDHTTTDATHALLDALRPEFPGTGGVLQAMLRRTSVDAARYATPGSRIRLCKGAYAEPASVAHTSGPVISDAFLTCLRTLVAGGGYPMIATHDPALIAAATDMVAAAGRPRDGYEFQLLHGVRPEEQLRLAEAGHTVRVYVPYGVDWYGYFTRRLAEKPANLALLGRALVSRH